VASAVAQLNGHRLSEAVAHITVAAQQRLCFLQTNFTNVDWTLSDIFIVETTQHPPRSTVQFNICVKTMEAGLSTIA